MTEAAWMTRLDALLARAEAVLERLDPAPPGHRSAPDGTAWAYRWRGGSAAGYLEPIPEPDCPDLDSLLHIDDQKAALVRNTRQFLLGAPANNALLWGSRGTGKSSLVRALLGAYAPDGLRLVEVPRDDLGDLPTLAGQLRGRTERFILFSDDLSFATGETHYTGLKATLDGALTGQPDNVLIYATSNRRHLMPEYTAENQDLEIHGREAIEEKISLAERFGLWLSFYGFDEPAYLALVDHWLARLGSHRGTREVELRQAALRFAQLRGGRNGRIAHQFARDQAGRERLDAQPSG